MPKDSPFGVELFQRFLGKRQHPPGAARRVVNLPDDSLAAELFIVVDDDEVHDQSDNLARREVLAGGFVGDF